MLLKSFLLTGIAIISLAPVLAFAQGAEGAQGVQDLQAGQGVDEIVVTAQKREQRLQDVGIAITALGKSALKSFGRQDISALANLAPSLQTNQFSPTVTVFNIRGVSQNDFADSQEAPITFYNDEVYVSALGAISGQTFDLDRVEILRGPQGTLFGRNATGGLVQVITAKPTKSLEGFAEITVGSYGQLASEAAVSGPITDRIRARISGTSNRQNGFIENRTGPNRGGARFYAGRAQIEADVGDTGLFRLKLQGMRNDHETSASAASHIATGYDADGLGFALAPGEDFWGTGAGNDAFGYRDADSNPFKESTNRDGRFSRTYWTLTARYEQDIGPVNIVSISDYQKLKKRYSEDSDISPIEQFNYDADQDLYQLSQEIRLSGQVGGLRWVTGGYGLKINTKNQYVSDFTNAFGLYAEYGGTQITESLAVFGQLEYKASEKISVIAGTRYSWDWKKIDFAQRQTDTASGDISTFLFDPATSSLAKQKFADLSGKIQVDVRPTEGVLLYAAVNRGTKSGGFGVQAIQPIDPAALPFGSEKLTNYEAGFKLTLSDRRLSVNGSVFHYDYDGYQAFTLINVSQFITNKAARVDGFELEVVASPVPGLTIQPFLSHLSTKVKGITLPFGRTVDRRMPQAPSWSFGGMLRYELPIREGLLSAQTDWKYNSAQFLSTFNAPIDREPVYVVGNARLSYDPEKNGLPIISVFVNNLTNAEYRIANFDFSASFGLSQQTFARPRWFGASVRFNL